MMLNSMDEEINPAYHPYKTYATEQMLIQFMTDWGNLSGMRNTARLAELLPDDLVLTMADGAFLTKIQYLDGFKEISADFTINDFDQHAFVHHETAIVTARYKINNGLSDAILRYTATFIKREGSWQPIAFHSCHLAIGNH